VTKTLGFKAGALFAGLGFSVVTLAGCNPEEPAKPTTPAAPPPVVRPTPKAEENKPAPPAATPAPAKEKEAEKK
jgi:hypothetical protein